MVRVSDERVSGCESEEVLTASRASAANSLRIC